MTEPGYRLVPEAVLLWLNGEGPDHEGYEFGEAPNRGPGSFWWRARLREMLAAAPQPEPPADLAERATERWKEFARAADGRWSGDHIVAAMAAFAQEHAAAEKARADKAEKALADEREACAKEADVYANGLGLHARAIGRFIAAAIRARKGGGDE